MRVHFKVKGQHRDSLSTRDSWGNQGPSREETSVGPGLGSTSPAPVTQMKQQRTEFLLGEVVVSTGVIGWLQTHVITRKAKYA